MRGLDVEVRHPVEGAADELGNPTRSWSEPETVGDVLVGAGPTADSHEANRPDGVTVAYTLVFPRGWTGSLRGRQVRVPGDADWYSVVGDPKATPDGQLPRRFTRNRVVEVTRDAG